MAVIEISRVRYAVAAALVGLVILLPACGSSGGDGGGGNQGGSGSGSGSGQTTESASGGETTGGMEGGGTTGMEDGGGSPDEARGGTWTVDDAGTVAFQASGGSLSLGDVSANSGWDQRVAADRNDEIEVHFTRGGTDWKFEAELDEDGLEVSRERDTQPADAGTYRVGDAAEATFSASGGSLSLDDLTVGDGWEVTKRDEASDDIEIDLRNGRQTAEFEVERSRGQNKLEISQKVTGPTPS